MTGSERCLLGFVWLVHKQRKKAEQISQTESDLDSKQADSPSRLKPIIQKSAAHLPASQSVGIKYNLGAGESTSERKEKKKKKKDPW